MSKPAWTPISASGFHNIQLNELHFYFVEPFDGESKRWREEMVQRLDAFFSELLKLKISVEIWLDGSFVTRCPTPQDIDLLILISYSQVANLPLIMQEKLSFLLNERDRIKLRYLCDIYHDDINSEQARNKWQREFGINYDGSEKGIFVIHHAA